MTKAQLPTYLVGSAFYNSLSSDDSDAFTIPNSFVKLSPSVSSSEDLGHLLHTMRFWGVAVLPQGLISFLVHHHDSQNQENTRAVLQEFDDDFKLLELYTKIQATRSRKDLLTIAKQSGRIEFVEFLVTSGRRMGPSMVKAAAEHDLLNLLREVTLTLKRRNRNPFTQVSTQHVARLGYSDCLRFLLESGCEKGPNLAVVAAEGGSVACLKIAMENGCTWCPTIAYKAALYGNFDCLVYACEQGCPVNTDATSGAARNGHFNCLQYLHEHEHPWDVSCGRSAAESGQLECLEYLIEEDCPLDHHVTNAAACAGQVDCLETLLEAGYLATCTGVDGAARHGHVDCLVELDAYDVQLCDVHIYQAIERDDKRYLDSLYQSDYELPDDSFKEALRNGSSACLDFLCSLDRYSMSDEDALVAIQENDLQCLTVLHKHGCPWNTETCAAAADLGHLECPQYAHENGCPWVIEEVLAAGVVNGHLDILRYAHQQGTEPDAQTCLEAARFGSVECLRYLHEEAGCVWDARTCVAAARGDALECLKYAREHGCEWNVAASIAAAEAGALRCLQYAVEQGCDVNSRTVTAAATAPTAACLKYLHERRYPWTLAVSRAAVVSHPCLRYCVQNNCPISAVILKEYQRQKAEIKRLKEEAPVCTCGRCFF